MNNIQSIYGNKLRVRVSGILIENNRVLLLKHKNIGEHGYLWAPPGGGMEYNSSAITNLKREFQEETGLTIEVRELMFVNEVMIPPLHALELFYLVSKIDGDLKLGFDPETGSDDQILVSMDFFSFEKINKMQENELHNLFKHCGSIPELLNMKGYFNY